MEYFQRTPCILHLTINLVTGEDKQFAGKQKGRCKYAEFALGVLQGKLHISALSRELRSTQNTSTIIYCFVALLDILVFEERLLMEISNERVGA